MDEIPTNIKAHGLQITRWMLTENQQLMKFNFGTYAEPYMVKINAKLETGKVLEVEQLLKEFKDVFCMDIQGFEKDSTRVSMTQNWIGHYYTVGTSSEV